MRENDYMPAIPRVSPSGATTATYGNAPTVGAARSRSRVNLRHRSTAPNGYAADPRCARSHSHGAARGCVLALAAVFARVVLVASLGALAGCTGPATMTLTLAEPLPLEVHAAPGYAFVDRSAPQTWYYLASASGLGDNPADPSDVRMTFTMLGDHAAIDSYTHGDLFFRAPGFPECDRFTGTLDLVAVGSGWRVDVDATCSVAPGYRVRGTLAGSD